MTMGLKVRLHEMIGDASEGLETIAEKLKRAIAYRNPSAGVSMVLLVRHLSATEEAIEKNERDIAFLLKNAIPKLERDMASLNTKILEASREFLNRNGLMALADRGGRCRLRTSTTSSPGRESSSATSRLT
jgi:hypothetical protein